MTKNYAITLIVPAGCKITNNTRYRDLTITEQKIFLKSLMSEGIYGLIPYDHVFEEHKDGRIHMHGRMIDCSAEHMRLKQVDINQLLGYSLDNKKIFYYKPETNWAGWDVYMQKHQQPDKDLFNLFNKLFNNDDLVFTKEDFGIII